MITQCADHVDYKLPNKLTCVNLLLSDIEKNDPSLNAAIEMVRGEKVTIRKMNKFEY